MVKKLSCRLIRLNPEKILQINPQNTFFFSQIENISLGLLTHSYFLYLNFGFHRTTKFTKFVIKRKV